MEQRFTDLENAIHARFTALEAKILTAKWTVVAGAFGLVLGLISGFLAR